jgi:hypothetical protein
MKTLNRLFILIAIVAFSCSAPSYEYSYTDGADTPEEVLKIVMEALEADDADKLSTVILNYDMESVKTLEMTREEIAKLKEAGDETTVQNYEKALQMYESKEYLEKLKTKQAEFPQKAAKELEETKAMFIKYAEDFSIISLDSIYVKDGVRNPETEKFVGVDFMKADSSMYNVQINAEIINGKWYYNGQKSAGLL